jgi:glycosyltransferase involved in cell wall biosynthesis
MNHPIASIHCLIGFDNDLGGAVHAALNVCKYLAQAGQEVEAVAPSSASDSVAYLSESYSEVRCNRVAFSFPKRFSNSNELAAWLESNLQRFDIVELHSVWLLSTLRAACICRKYGKPYIIRPHGSLDPFDLRKHSVLKKCLGPFYIKWLLRHSAAVVCTAQLEAERLETYGAAPKRVVLHLPVPLPSEPGNGKRFREKHHIPENAKVVLFLSRIDYKKGLDLLIPALGQLRLEFPELWFVLAGSGIETFVAGIHRSLKDNNIDSITSEVGFLSGTEKLDALAAANVFALPSRNENFGIVNIEAMNAGIPLLISSEVYIAREIVGAGAGRVCQLTVESTADELRKMLNGSVELREMGKLGQHLAQTLFRPEASTESLIALYAQICGR